MKREAQFGIEEPVTNSDYYSNVRTDVIAMIPPRGMQRALEIGGGDFRTLLQLKDARGFEAWGVDIRQPADSLDLFVLGSITDAPVHAQLPDDGFDLIIANDVIEHIADTNAFLDVLKAKLSPGGLLVISVPNARQVRLVYHVFLRGRFPRDDAGLFDRTHLRWFCKKDVLEVFGRVGFRLLDTRSTGRFVPRVISRSLLAEFLALQNIFCFTK